MEDWMYAYSDDYSDLGFDVERHKEAFRRFSESNIDPGSVRAILRARNALLFEFPGTLFHVGSATDFEHLSTDNEDGSLLAAVPLHHAEDPAEIELVWDDVARYLQRHFPGRCLDMGKSTAVAEGARIVYLALFDPEVSDIQ